MEDPVPHDSKLVPLTSHPHNLGCKFQLWLEREKEEQIQNFDVETFWETPTCKTEKEMGG
jgi:hypothetical protein